MNVIKEIKKPIQQEMLLFEKKFRNSLNSKIPLLDKILHYIVKRKGKQMRPMFVFLTGKLFGNINESSFRAASLIELLHTATLVHDDVIDDANMRRGFFSINALWKNKIAVLVGDYLLSQGLLMSLENKEYDLLQIVSKAVKDMSEGELLQIEKARKLDIKEDIYFEIIRQKTATLIAACCASGAAAANQDKETIERMRKFGELIGIAFQMKDDLFDYYNEDIIGKPTGIDIKEQKMTLPLIYTLENADKKQKRFIIKTVKNHNTNSERVAQVLDIVKKSGGINYTIDKMKSYQKEALDVLKTFDDNESRKSLELLVNFVIERKK
ncbi:polyprenyl synthetase family protein [Flavobacteriales bacterium]|jgi:octaprenyl-diphosphate synthase|nr:polyprenyl synthetase family protein [Flavobacteriales bacterium]MDB2368796.1 polyprenyl synthetase family protein [Flavobacteriales bacterium]